MHTVLEKNVHGLPSAKFQIDSLNKNENLEKTVE